MYKLWIRLGVVVNKSKTAIILMSIEDQWKHLENNSGNQTYEHCIEFRIVFLL